MAQQYRQRPSDLLAIPLSDGYTRYCLDEAVFFLGKTIDGELSEAENGAKNKSEAIRKRQLVMSKYFNEGNRQEKVEPDKPASKPTGGSGFADPAVVFGKRK